ncbi:PAS sensor, serine phosphatase RsbU regulator of sigma subunit [Nitrosococcus oceani ATCC 19707]|uniref:PAS sensor, serine phosphatase RsbU regulator of sigma subunit n=2 Tax=Nitrosococcus oceani TaxID=1229 RepID=Q3J6X5_NITOC|nr:PAS domain S-box protein [Nitrosococcus oceani]ABA59421.1 PAS sensor, serine phosphatase RsbU regulator of sigma subunit [Nitrosococcus oceani ATCC 19707]EDZ66466.1 PAS fold family [Nitrosococcus oceani AFC27]KFI18163.1 diguanylate cyclase [Nitrosococcus oceani C-27]GEM20008.1 diguanylate cyclase [Nitrosococcus oceani]
MLIGEDTEMPVNKRKEEQNCDLLWALLNNAADGIIVIDEEGRIILTNTATEHFFGYRQQEMIGQDMRKLIPDYDKCLTDHEKIISSEREVTGRRKDGNTFLAHLSISEIQHGGQRLFAGVIRDFTTHKQGEIDAQRLAAIVESSEDAIISKTLDGIVISWNSAAQRIYGYSAEEICGQSISILAPPDRADEIPQILQHIRRGERIKQFETVRMRKDGREMFVSLTISPIKNSQGSITGAATIARDITRRKQREEKLLWLSRALEQSPVAVTITDTAGNIQYVNAKFTQLTGYHREEIIGRNPRILQSGKTSLEEYQQLWSTIISGREWRGEIQDKKKNGEIYWILEQISPIKNTQGEITHFLAIEEDISERKQIEKALQESEERFRQVAKMTGEWIWERDSSGRFIYCSGAVKEILGYEPKEMFGKHYSEFFTLEAQEGKPCKSPQSGKRFFRIVCCYRHKDGREVFTESSGEPLLDERGQIVKWRGLDRDITKRLEAQELIRRAQISLAVTRNELRIAQQIQESLLPTESLVLPEVQVVGHCLPASQVGGDYFDYYYRQSDNTVDVTIADVSGHSVGPALFMVETRSALKTQIRSKFTAANTLAALNDSLYEDLNGADHFITMFYMQYHIATGEINYASAGHNPPLLLRRNEAVCNKLEADGLIFGVKKEVSFEEKRTFLKKGDLVFLYTDGIVEAESKQGEFFGIHRLSKILVTHRHLAAQELIKVIVKDLQGFCESKNFRDDATMVILKVM